MPETGDVFLNRVRKKKKKKKRVLVLSLSHRHWRRDTGTWRWLRWQGGVSHTTDRAGRFHTAGESKKASLAFPIQAFLGHCWNGRGVQKAEALTPKASFAFRA